jgi:hypothetical protein
MGAEELGSMGDVNEAPCEEPTVRDWRSEASTGAWEMGSRGDVTEAPCEESTGLSLPFLTG